MAEPGCSGIICIEVIRAWPRRHEVTSLTVQTGTTVSQALEASGLALEGITGCAVFGERVSGDHRLRDGDRIELLRPLQSDPKDARRRRALKPQ